jgi:hypothetical protein
MEASTKIKKNNNNNINSNNNRKSNDTVLVICDACFWAATYIEKSRLPVHDTRCSMCNETELSSFPILQNESFTYYYSEKNKGAELKFESMNNKR